MPVMIADTGCANLASVRFALERLGIAAKVSDDPKQLKAAERMILPGVGSASAGMHALRAKGLLSMLESYTRPVLGICLGMQLLFKRSEEGNTECLGLLEDEVVKLAAGSAPVPHMGWNTISITRDTPLLAGVPTESYVYFVHSFAAGTGPYTLATTKYGAPFSAVVNQDNFYGCQFHPERSGAVGARILDNFMRISP